MTIRTVVAPAVALDSVTRTYRSRAGSVHALRGVTHAFAAGTSPRSWPLGVGKSTLAARGRPRQADRWPVYISGTDLGGLRETRVDEVPSTAMAFIFQSYNLLDALSAFDNVALPTRLAGLRSTAPPSPTRWAGWVYGAVQAPAIRTLRGQQQRVAIARALRRKPDVLFADEPTGTGPQHRPRRPGSAWSPGHGGQTVVMVTHDPLAASYAGEALSFSLMARSSAASSTPNASAIAQRMSEPSSERERAHAQGLMSRLSQQTVRTSWPAYLGALPPLRPVSC